MTVPSIEIRLITRSVEESATLALPLGCCVSQAAPTVIPMEGEFDRPVIEAKPLSRCVVLGPRAGSKRATACAKGSPTPRLHPKTGD